MKNTYSRPLKVSSPEGERIIANILRFGDKVQIEIAPLEVVKKDDPPFAHNGVIRYKCTIENYRKAIDLLTKYLEDLFLKGMADEDTYSSLGAKPKPRRTQKIDTGRKTEKSEGKGDLASLHSRARRSESSESPRGREPGLKMAESSDKETGGKDSGGD